MAAGSNASPALQRVLRERELTDQASCEPQHAAHRRAAQQLSQLGWPSARDEQWRYANLHAFERVPSYRPALPLADAARAALLSQLPAPVPGFERHLFIDGRPVTPLGTPNALLAPAWSTEQRLGWLTELFADAPASLQLDGERALEVLFLNSSASAGAAAYPQLRLQLQPGSRVQLIERHLGDPASTALVCAAVQLELGREVELQHYRLQQCGAQVVFTDSLSATLDAGAQYRVRQLATGAGTARTSAHVVLAGRAAAFSWHSIAVGRGRQVIDTALKVEHRATDTQVDEVFRGIADEQARIAFSGHVHILPQALRSQVRQSLRGLIEGAGAEIDLRPRLEIQTDEVQAQHGATTGRLDEQLLFYLLSRGLDRSTARALLKWAFLGDVLREFSVPQLRREAEHGAAGQLRDAIELGEAFT